MRMPVHAGSLSSAKVTPKQDTKRIEQLPPAIPGRKPSVRRDRPAPRPPLPQHERGPAVGGSRSVASHGSPVKRDSAPSQNREGCAAGSDVSASLLTRQDHLPYMRFQRFTMLGTCQCKANFRRLIEQERFQAQPVLRPPPQQISMGPYRAFDGNGN